MPLRNLIALVVLLTVVGGVSLNTGYSWGWEARDGQEPREDAASAARLRQIDAGLRGFLEDDRP